MTMPYRRQRLLRRMDRKLCRSDPHLTAMLAMFARLNAGEAITSREQAHPGTRVRRGLAWLGDATACIAICLADCTCWAFRRVAILCAVVRWRFSGRAGKVSVPPAWHWPTTGRP
ncbi:MAG: hypothetical protein ACRDOH_32225 [Streptosporangiaceae bacterium]